LIQKPQGEVTGRVKEVGPEHFGVLCFDCAKARSKFMLADFYGKLIITPQTVEHTQGPLRAALDQVRQAREQYQLTDLVVAVERTGEYHRLVQRACRRNGLDTRLVHPFTSKQFRQVANPGDKTDDNDLAAIFRAAVNGFGLIEPVWPDEYQQLQLLARQRRDLVNKMTVLCNQEREYLHALMPGYAESFGNLWEHLTALPLARVVTSNDLLRDRQQVMSLLAKQQLKARSDFVAKVVAWAGQAPAEPPHAQLRRQQFVALDDDRLSKNTLIARLERQIAQLLCRTPFVLLLVFPGISIVNAADVAGEAGPLQHYASANAITGRAGLVPSRYQSDLVDHDNGPLRRAGNRRLRNALMHTADSLVAVNHHFNVMNIRWQQQGKDPRWVRVKVAKIFSRLLFAIVGGRQLFDHPARQDKHYITRKLIEFHRQARTPLPEVMADLQSACLQLPRSACSSEAVALNDYLKELPRKGPQPMAELIPMVLARLQARMVQSDPSEDVISG
jgi:transposase